MKNYCVNKLTFWTPLSDVDSPQLFENIQCRKFRLKINIWKY
jgi:hypothetical protein